MITTENVQALLNNTSYEDMENGNFLDDYNLVLKNDDNSHILYGFYFDYYGDAVVVDLTTMKVYSFDCDENDYQLEYWFTLDTKDFENDEFNNVQEFNETMKSEVEDWNYDNLVEHVNNSNFIN